jgi:hypothetical protein
MALNNGKHIVEEIDGIRCTLIEKDLDENRMRFLRDILHFNGLKVVTGINSDGNFSLGVTDLVFNPVITIYEKGLKRRDGHIVTPAYWNQKSDQTTIPYWLVR